MIELSPKALRFARLAAQKQASFSGDPRLQILQEEEARYSRMPKQTRADAHVSVSRDAAAFCLSAVRALLSQEHLFKGAEWDGNDFAFLTSVVRDLDRQLAHSAARAV